MRINLLLMTFRFWIVAWACAGVVVSAQNPDCKGPEELERVLKSHPSPGAYDAVGTWFARQRGYPCAISAFQSALRLDPHFWEAHFNLGLALLESGDSGRAALCDRQPRVRRGGDPSRRRRHICRARAGRFARQEVRGLGGSRRIAVRTNLANAGRDDCWRYARLRALGASESRLGELGHEPAAVAGFEPARGFRLPTITAVTTRAQPRPAASAQKRASG